MVAAVRNGHIEIVRLMLAQGADDFNIGLMIAALRGHLDIVLLMLE